MAALEEDARKALQKRVYDLAMAGNSVKLKAQLGEHPEIDVDEYKQSGRMAFFGACAREHTACARLLIDHSRCACRELSRSDFTVRSNTDGIPGLRQAAGAEWG
jgi:uncharacterized ParB-like nuclease family protein